MASPRLLRPLPVLLLTGLLSAALPGPASAGPLVRRAQERRACQEFAGKLQQASGNPAMAQQVYQQGVLQLVQRFGENPCGDIPAPTASGTPGAPASTTAAPAATATPAAASAEQQQACQQFAGKLQSAAASGGAAAAQQTYAMGVQKLTGMYGANPCPGVTPPR
ncbi:hypothetical protein NZK33_17895 [Cyanobium sp. FGCU-6]|jgi:hypothetical protein|nr:hypothetical protein [Cyanobium sp. FGCU6]